MVVDSYFGVEKKLEPFFVLIFFSSKSFDLISGWILKSWTIWSWKLFLGEIQLKFLKIWVKLKENWPFYLRKERRVKEKEKEIFSLKSRNTGFLFCWENKKRFLLRAFMSWLVIFRVEKDTKRTQKLQKKKGMNSKILEFHQRKERIFRQKIQKLERERLKKLKENDMEGYLKLLEVYLSHSFFKKKY